MAEGTLVKGTQVYVSSLPQNDNLTQVEFEGLTWIPVCCPSTSPSFSEEAEVVSEFCISGEEVTAVGAASGAETELAVFYQHDCEGQDIVRDAFGGQNALAFRKEYADSPNPTTTTNTIIYTRALVTSWSDEGEGVNDFIVHNFGLKIAQPPILVKPEPV